VSLTLCAYFNSSKNPFLISPLLLVLDSTIFPPSFTSFNGSKSPLERAWSTSNFIRLESFSSSNYVKVFSPINVQDHPSFLHPNSFIDLIITPYPSIPFFVGLVVAPYPTCLFSYVVPTIVISLDPNVSSHASPHVQDIQNHELIPRVDLFDYLFDIEPNPRCKK
jgi:hypothetical protein